MAYASLIQVSERMDRSSVTKTFCGVGYYKHNRGFLVYRHFLFWASSDAIFYLHISKELIELFRIAILTFENEAHSEEL